MSGEGPAFRAQGLEMAEKERLLREARKGGEVEVKPLTLRELYQTPEAFRASYAEITSIAAMLEWFITARLTTISRDEELMSHLSRAAKELQSAADRLRIQHDGAIHK